jgi:hypothetical protein
MIRQVLESVTGMNMSTTINFQNLEIDIPKGQGPDGRDLGSAKWTVNGKIIWTTKLHKAEEIDRGVLPFQKVLCRMNQHGVAWLDFHVNSVIKQTENRLLS